MMLVSLTGYGTGALGGQKKERLTVPISWTSSLFKEFGSWRTTQCDGIDNPGWCHGVEDDPELILLPRPPRVGITGIHHRAGVCVVPGVRPRVSCALEHQLSHIASPTPFPKLHTVLPTKRSADCPALSCVTQDLSPLCL